MNYFDRDYSTGEWSDDLISKISTIVEEFYNKKSNSDLNKDDRLRLHHSTVDAKTSMALISTLLSGKITMGDINQQYENKYSNYMNVKHALSCNSGSSANLLIISSLVELGRLRPGDKVLVPALSWSTTVFPLVQHGLIPVFIDQSESDYNIDLDLVDQWLSTNKASALMLIHTYGCAANMTKCLEICNKHDLLLIEDTCESMGASWDGQKVGSFGIASSFSSYYSHHICTLEGGLVCTSDEELWRTMQSVRSHGWLRHLDTNSQIFQQYSHLDPSFLFGHVGYNLRLSEPQAAMGIEQLNNLDVYVESRRLVGQKYRSLLKSFDSCLKMQIPLPPSYSSYFGMPIILSNSFADDVIKRLRVHLASNNIETRPFLAGDFTSQPVMNSINHLVPFPCKVASNIGKYALALPCHQDMDVDDVSRVVSSIESFLNSNSK